MQRLFFEMECSCDPRGVADPSKKWMRTEWKGDQGGRELCRATIIRAGPYAFVCTCTVAREKTSEDRGFVNCYDGKEKNHPQKANFRHNSMDIICILLRNVLNSHRCLDLDPSIDFDSLYIQPAMI